MTVPVNCESDGLVVEEIVAVMQPVEELYVPVENATQAVPLYQLSDVPIPTLQRLTFKVVKLLPEPSTISMYSPVACERVVEVGFPLP
jgi:hypothetical protein